MNAVLRQAAALWLAFLTLIAPTALATCEVEIQALRKFLTLPAGHEHRQTAVQKLNERRAYTVERACQLLVRETLAIHYDDRKDDGLLEEILNEGLDIEGTWSPRLPPRATEILKSLKRDRNPGPELPSFYPDMVIARVGFSALRSGVTDPIRDVYEQSGLSIDTSAGVAVSISTLWLWKSFLVGPEATWRGSRISVGDELNGVEESYRNFDLRVPLLVRIPLPRRLAGTAFDVGFAPGWSYQTITVVQDGDDVGNTSQHGFVGSLAIAFALTLPGDFFINVHSGRDLVSTANDASGEDVKFFDVSIGLGWMFLKE